MRRLRYSVAMSLDGYIADLHGGYDWIIQDPAIDFGAYFKQFDAAVMGRGTFEVMLEQGSDGLMPGMQVIVFSRTLRADGYPAVTIVDTDPVEFVSALKARSGKDIWLFGGGVLFRTFLDAGLVDTIEVGVIPVVLGEGIPLVAVGRPSPALRLTDTKAYPSGIMMLSYEIERPA